jgi:hypothetical protein
LRGVSKDGSRRLWRSFEARPRGRAPQDDGRIFWRPLFIYIKFFKFAGIVIPASRTSLILLASCPVRGRFLEAILHRTERELAGPGRPGTVDRLVAMVERREALRPTSLGARGWRYQLRKAGPLLRLKGASQASWRLPPLHPLAWVREGLANLGRIAPRECRRLAV